MDDGDAVLGGDLRGARPVVTEGCEAERSADGKLTGLSMPSPVVSFILLTGSLTLFTDRATLFMGGHRKIRILPSLTTQNPNNPNPEAVSGRKVN